MDSPERARARGVLSSGSCSVPHLGRGAGGCEGGAVGGRGGLPVSGTSGSGSCSLKFSGKSRTNAGGRTPGGEYHHEHLERGGKRVGIGVGRSILGEWGVFQCWRGSVSATAATLRSTGGGGREAGGESEEGRGGAECAARRSWEVPSSLQMGRGQSTERKAEVAKAAKGAKGAAAGGGGGGGGGLGVGGKCCSMCQLTERGRLRGSSSLAMDHVGAGPAAGGGEGGGGGGGGSGVGIHGRGILQGLLAAMVVFAVFQYAVLLISEQLLVQANSLGRRCYRGLPRQPPFPVGAEVSSASGPVHRLGSGDRRRFAMVTCSDGASTIPERSFEGLAEMIAPNKAGYVKRHGYDFIDASDVLDRRRPPSWSKILAVRKHLQNYDWVFWTDADSVVMNPDVTLQEVVDSIIAGPDLQNGILPDFIVTEDFNGVNAGMFFVRNSSWSMQFLDQWWNMTDFIQPFGLCKSGDNDALKHLIANMDDDERRRHIRIPEMQCAFNSYLWHPSLRATVRLWLQPRALWRGGFAKGDFMVHLAGLNNKKKYVLRVLKELDHVSKMPEEVRWGKRWGRWRRRLGFYVYT